MVTREDSLQSVSLLLHEFPVTALLGPRQCGKTTLARALTAERFYDLENPRDLAALAEPQTALERHEGLVIIDEVQRLPELFPLLRHLVDLHPQRRYLLLGSASRDLVSRGAESLAGRIAFYQLAGFSAAEVAPTLVDPSAVTRRHWLRGGFPRSYLADSDNGSVRWRQFYVQTFLERDLPDLGLKIPARTLTRFWTMLSHYHGQILNLSELGRAFGISEATVRRYLDILEGTFMIRLVQPWYANTGKRLVKAPKLYLRDSGLFHTLQDIATFDQLESHPKLGASWEGYVVEEALRHLGIRAEEAAFYRTHAGTETDLVWSRNGKTYGLEVKYGDAPRLTPSIRNSLEDLGLDHLWVVYPGDTSWALDPRVTVLPMRDLSSLPRSPA